MALPKELFLQKMAEGRARKAAERVAQTKPIKSSIPMAKVEPINGGNNGNGEHEKTLLQQDIEKEQNKGKPPPIIIPSQLNAFSHDRGTQAVDYIVRPGDSVKDLFMRTNFDSNVENIAWSEVIIKSREFHRPEVEEQGLLIISGKPSIGGQSREQLIQAIVGGDPKSVSKGQMDFKNKIKQLAFGKKKTQEEAEKE